MHLAVAHRQIAAFDQKKPEIAGEVGLLEIGFVKRTRRQQADTRVRALRHRGEAKAERLEERRQPFDIHITVEGRESAGQDKPVGERIASARRRLRTVAKNPPAAIRTTPDVGGVNMQEFAAWRFHPVQGMEKLGAAGDGGSGQIARGDQPALAVNIGQQQFHEPRALLDPLRDLAPFAGLDEKRHMRERPGALARIPIGAIGHARVANMPVGGGKALADIVGAKFRQRGEKPQPMRARAPVRADEFIRDARQRLVTGRELSHPPGRVADLLFSWSGALRLIYAIAWAGRILGSPHRSRYTRRR